MKKDLPSKYYLAHFNELIDFIKSHCMMLLDQQHIDFINKTYKIDEQSQCMLARIYSRKPLLLSIDTLNYNEIPQPQQAIYDLLSCGLICYANKKYAPQLLHHLTKPRLLSLLTQANPSLVVKKSINKAQLIEQVTKEITAKPSLMSSFYAQFIVNNRSENFEYFEFLYAGRLSQGDLNHRNRFVMRDLGLTTTKKHHTKNSARFETKEQAQSSYALNKHNLTLKNACDEQHYKTLAQEVIAQEAIGSQAVELKNKLLVKLYHTLKKSAPTLSFNILQACEDCPHALEIQLREQYRLGNKEWVKNQLDIIIQHPINDDLLYFADDFLMRKYNKQTRSRLTTMLTQADVKLSIDEIYRNDVELGVNAYYSEQGYKVFNTENTVWQRLFGLAFWHELFIETPYPACNEFDIYPHVLKTDTFYQAQQTQIEARLASWTDQQALLRTITKNMVQYFQHPNGLFRWHDELLAPLEALILNSPISVILNHLKNMCMQFKNLKDGYPDLMVLKNGSVYFEEVKAPGDKIRRNQLTTIESLKNTGFNVNIATVTWFDDPERIYSVVDIETTGGVKGGNKITEVGLVKVQNKQVIERWSTLINPQKRIPKFIVSLTGITDKMVADAPVFSQVMPILLKKLQGSIFVAHNVNFDYGFIQRECESAGHRFKMPKLCTVVESRKAFPGLKSYSLGNLSHYFDLNLTSHHRALADASATAELLILIKNNEK